MVNSILRLSKKEKAFLAKFLALFALLFSMVWLFDLPPLNAALAFAEGELLSHAGVPAIVGGNIIAVGGLSARIVNECSGLVMVALLVALLYSHDIPRKSRLRALAVFVPFLLAFNALRLFATLYVFFAANAWFDAVHVALWLVDSAVVLACWYVAFSRRI
ncbi:MAG: archaeosortase/exosortase family protein [Candidatus Micrarchaeota archaeon]